MLGIPPPTSMDLRLRLFGVPIRISPFFWLTAFVLGALIGSDWSGPSYAAIAAACIGLSVLVHELGHGLTARSFGLEPSIVMHGLGGVCVTRDGPGTFGPRLLTIVMGPLAGLALAIATVILWALLTFNQVAIGPRAEFAMMVLLVLNVLYSLLNLVPIWPLDGGQFLVTIMDRLSPRNGLRRGHILSFLASAGAAVIAVFLSQGHSPWPPQLPLMLAIWLGSYAFMNFILLSHYHRLALADREGG